MPDEELDRGQEKLSSEEFLTTAVEEDLYAVPDRLTGLAGVAELRKISPGRQWNFVEVGSIFMVCAIIDPVSCVTNDQPVTGYEFVVFRKVSFHNPL